MVTSVGADTALYFSLVTWTTLGYGDFHPSNGIALLAGLEAILGYIYLEIAVAMIAVHLDGKDSRPPTESPG